MVFNNEADFEKALIQALSEKGWEQNVIEYPTEEELLQNWAKILFENNRDIYRLNDYPLTAGEMGQIMEQIRSLRTPLKLNSFINGKTVTIKRDNPQDTRNFGKEVSLKIYDRKEIAAGQSRYQIVRQPRFSGQNTIYPQRRGDLMLLINGMPVIHIELKKSGIPVSQACCQIEKYAHERVFSGLFSLIQIFVAMEPNETLYFANPGPDGKFNPDYFFHWADFNNEPINQWDKIASTLLSIPMAHQLIGFYTVADDSDGVLKVMRSYQYYAADAVSRKVSEIRWDEENQRGGYIWHTTGSGKTMTSFKSAQLIAASKDADKVIFLMDRIELGTQSLKEYRAFAAENESVQATESTAVLVKKLKSSYTTDTLIVTSIQKMSKIKEEAEGLKSADVAAISKKRLVFIVDEAHRSTFGEMLTTIKNTFPKAVFFGFTGTPIFKDNQKKNNTTDTVFGKQLHKYTIAHGIRDKNVLGFDPYKVLTFRDKDVRKAVALEKAKAQTEEEAIADEKKSKIYYTYMDASQVPMAGYYDEDGKYVKGIEDDIPPTQYRTKEHTESVVKDILENWTTLSRNSKFHAIFATSSIPEAIHYYRLFKEKKPELKVTALFDPYIDNKAGEIFKEDGLVEIIEDYNKRYAMNFTMPTFANMKKDMAARLAHKKPYERIDSDKQIDLLIVVDQMLTGFDSKWINTLYLDKVLRYEHIIQAFSRTNRLFGPDKPFGTIRYYRKPHTMEKYIKEAFEFYSGYKPLGLFVQRLPENLKKMNELFESISALFTNAGIENMEKLPDDMSVCRKFVKDFNEFNGYLEAAKIQGFKWDTQSYTDTETGETIEMTFNEKDYLVSVLRYKELSGGTGGRTGNDDIPYDLKGYITEIQTGLIDTDYMNFLFEKYFKLLHREGVSSEDVKQAEHELHQTFATLSQEEQKYANIYLHDIQRGDWEVCEGKTFRDYITEYMSQAQDERIHKVADMFGVDESKLRKIVESHPTETNLNEFGRYEELKGTVNKEKARAYFEKAEGIKPIPPKVLIKVDEFLRKFILKGKFES